MFDGNITPSLESPFFKDLNDACCISGGQMQPAKIKFKSTISSVMQQTLHTQPQRENNFFKINIFGNLGSSFGKQGQ